MPNNEKNLTSKTTAERLAGLLNTYYAKKTDLPSKVSDLTNDSNFQTETQVDSKISAAVSGALKPSGSIAFASLPALSAANCNKIFNITDAFVTTADFAEGADKDYPAGTNVAIINAGTEQTPVYKYDCYTGAFDFSGFATKVSGASNGDLAGLDANGNLTDSGVAASNVMRKVASATAGNVATLNASGEAQDSGVALSNVLLASDLSDYSEAELRTLLGLPAAE